MDRLRDECRVAFRKVKQKLGDHLNGLSPLELGLLAALSAICIFQLVVLVLQWTRFVLVTYNLLRVLAAVFCLFSLYTWLAVVCGGDGDGARYWTDSGIYLLFFTCFLSEFLVQFVEFNANARYEPGENVVGDLVSRLSEALGAVDKTPDAPLERRGDLAFLANENTKHVLLVAILCALTNLLTSLQARQSLLLIAVVCLTRLYGSIYFSGMLPVSVCAYFSYSCAFAGLVFAEYVKVRLASSLKPPAPSPPLLEAAQTTTFLPKNPNGLLATSLQQPPHHHHKPRHSSSSQHKNSISSCSSSTNRSANNASMSNGTLVNHFGGKPSTASSSAANPPSRRKLGTAATGNLNAFSNLPHLQYKRRTSLPIISTQQQQHQQHRAEKGESQQLREVQHLVNELLYGDDTLSLSQNKALKRIRKLVFQLATAAAANNNLLASANHLNSSHATITNKAAAAAAAASILPPLAALQNGLTKANIYRNYPPFSFISSTNSSEATSNEINCDLSDNCDMNSADEEEEDESRLLPTFTANFAAISAGGGVHPLLSSEAKSLKSRMRRSLPGPVSSLSGAACAAKRPLWSTTTSATGLPNIESIPSRQRTLSLKIPANPLMNMSPTGGGERSPLNSKCSSLIECFGGQLQLPDNQNQEESAEMTKYEEEEEEFEETKIGGANGNNGNTAASVNNKTSDYDSGESPNNSDYNSDTDKLHLKDFNSHQAINKKLDEILEESASSNNLCKLLAEPSSIYSAKTNGGEKPRLPWHPDDLDENGYLDHLNDWSFPIFQFYDTNKEHVLSQIAYKIFDNVGLFGSFSIPVDAFVRFFSELESGYQDLPYHNRVHAADVLHACYYLTTQRIPGLLKADALGNIASLKERAALNSNQYSLSSPLKCTLDSGYYGCVGNNMTPLELLALYCSAAMHDYEHPGRNNQFLVSVSSPLALLYNDKSVLENHHAAASWKLLMSDAKFNFLVDLERDEWKRFRFLCLENILATDLNRHFAIISDFKTRFPFTNQQTMGGLNALNWKNEQDRLLVSQVILKLADINAPLKDRELHIKWTERIVEEFYQQGEEEMRRGLPVSPFMDRKKPQVAQLQQNFITNLVGTLFHAYIESGLLPGILIEDPESISNDDEDDEDASSETDSDANPPDFYKKKPLKCKPKVLYSELQSNYISNFKMWVEKIKQEQQAVAAAAASSSVSATATSES